jgi:hypothetical protein
MKVDYDLIRYMLLKIEESDVDTLLDVSYFVNDQYSKEQIFYHLQLLLDCSYVEARLLVAVDVKDFKIIRMTMQGHQYLDSIRDSKIWNDTLNLIKKHTGSISLDIVKLVATKLIQTNLGL